jgi:hypothetical protein
LANEKEVFMEAFLHQFLSGLATGGIYASLALALVMIYQSTHHVNFAQGEMAMFSTFIAWMLIQAGLPYWVAFALTIGLSFFMGAIIEFAVVRPTSKAPLLRHRLHRRHPSAGRPENLLLVCCWPVALAYVVDLQVPGMSGQIARQQT